jgi:hypothetical protein
MRIQTLLATHLEARWIELGHGRSVLRSISDAACIAVMIAVAAIEGDSFASHPI